MANRFPQVPKDQMFADDLGYITKAPKKKYGMKTMPITKPAPRVKNLLGKT